jgi:hypothetical protein
MDDKIKLSSEMGDDGWDSRSYLNIWVGSIGRIPWILKRARRSVDKDGVVISRTAFGNGVPGVYTRGRTAIHEVGHWLGLRHLWGDTDCGDDEVVTLRNKPHSRTAALLAFGSVATMVQMATCIWIIWTSQ